MADARFREFPVSVKDAVTKTNYMISVSIGWNVAQVKREITSRSGLPPNQFQLVFNGQILEDENTLKDVGVQSTSTLHCVRDADVRIQRSTPTKPVFNEANLTRQLSSVHVEANPPPPAKVEQQTNFYVYCKKPCGAMARGKLRVRCYQCKSTSFVLHQGPSSWKDVLTPRSMSGRCINRDCRGDVAEFYFKCANHHTLSEDSSVSLHMIRNNNVGVECITCATAAGAVVVFDCDVGHSMCVGCFVEYIKDALNHRAFKKHPEYGYTIQCPNKCEGSEVKEIHHFRIMGEKDYGRYQDFGTEEYLREMGGVFCPKARCGNGMIPEYKGQRRIKCSECQFEFCAECQGQYHTGSCTTTPEAQQAPQGGDLNRFNQYVDRARWDLAANERYVRKISKACPSCKAAIQKTEGCNHMTCFVCKFEFCWLCLVGWNGNCQDDHWFLEE